MGRLEITCGNEYTTESPEVYTNIEIDSARFFGFEELTQFLEDIALHVTNGNSDERRNAQQGIQSALTRTLWDNYRISPHDDPDFEQWGELTVSLHGTAFFSSTAGTRLLDERDFGRAIHTNPARTADDQV